jgi:ubiquinone/menaquinone biosynthesis C-methylase UbiE
MSSEFWKKTDPANVPGGNALPSAEFQALLPNGAQILDMGCGNGIITEFLANQGSTVTGVDINSVMVKQCTERSIPNTKFVEHDLMQHLPFEDKTFDAVVCAFVLVNIMPSEKRVALLAEVSRVLKKGGVVWIHEGLVSEKYKLRYELCSPFTAEKYDFFSYKHKETAGNLLTVDAVKNAIETGEVERTVHHFTEKELSDLFVGYEQLSWKVQSLHAPRSGNPLESVVAMYRLVD